MDVHPGRCVPDRPQSADGSGTLGKPFDLAIDLREVRRPFAFGNVHSPDKTYTSCSIFEMNHESDIAGKVFQNMSYYKERSFSGCAVSRILAALKFTACYRIWRSYYV
jgi:hypothetical protein